MWQFKGWVQVKLLVLLGISLFLGALASDLLIDRQAGWQEPTASAPASIPTQPADTLAQIRHGSQAELDD